MTAPEQPPLSPQVSRIDMLTSDWHTLIAPVLPHASTDRDLPDLCVVRLECAQRAVFGVATDRCTLAARRHDLRDPIRCVPEPIHLGAADAATTLKLFRYSREEDPELRITVGTVTIPVEAAGWPAHVSRQALTLESPDGTRLVLHDRRDPAADPLAAWRAAVGAMWERTNTLTAPVLSLSAAHLTKWVKAVRKGERMTVYAGEGDGAPLLILVEDHFVGVWAQVTYLDSPDKLLAGSPWRPILAPSTHLLEDL